MSNNKQSSVEWLINKCACADLRPELWNIIKEQAKEMHKQEIVNAYTNGDNDGYRYMNNQKQEFEHGEQYYNETFEDK